MYIREIEIEIMMMMWARGKMRRTELTSSSSMPESLSRRFSPGLQQLGKLLLSEQCEISTRFHVTGGEGRYG